MPRRIRTDAFDSRVDEMRGRGLTDQQIADQLRCSRQTVRNARRRAPLAGRVVAPPAESGARAAFKMGRRDGMTRRAGAAALEAATGDDPAEGEDVPLDLAEQRLELSRLFRSYAKQARTLRDSDPAASHVAGRLASVFAGALSRVTVPEPPRDPNEHPDMIAAAEHGRAKLWGYVEAASLGKS